MNIRIPLTDIIVTRANHVAARVHALAQREAEERAAEIVKRWAHNSACLRAAMAAQIGVGPEFALEEAASLTRAMSRAIEAFAGEMARQRGES